MVKRTQKAPANVDAEGAAEEQTYEEDPLVEDPEEEEESIDDADAREGGDTKR